MAAEGTTTTKTNNTNNTTTCCCAGVQVQLDQVYQSDDNQKDNKQKINNNKKTSTKTTTLNDYTQQGEESVLFIVQQFEQKYHQEKLKLQNQIKDVKENEWIECSTADQSWSSEHTTLIRLEENRMLLETQRREFQNRLLSALAIEHIDSPEELWLKNNPTLIQKQTTTTVGVGSKTFLSTCKEYVTWAFMLGVRKGLLNLLKGGSWLPAACISCLFYFDVSYIWEFVKCDVAVWMGGALIVKLAEKAATGIKLGADWTDSIVGIIKNSVC